MRPNERIIKRFQSIRIPEFFTNSSYVTQHPRSFPSKNHENRQKIHKKLINR
jgi:hypothetical protein